MSLIQLRAQLSWFMMAVSLIAMMTFQNNILRLKSYWFYFQLMTTI